MLEVASVFAFVPRSGTSKLVPGVEELAARGVTGSVIGAMVAPTETAIVVT